MKFSYSVSGHIFLESIDLPISEGFAYLITGIGNTSYAILGGIIARLFPITETLEWPQLQALIENYSGNLTIEEGILPNSASYVGFDPERHLLFSRVEEEFLAQGIEPSKFPNGLLNFGLEESFLERRIATLSGGEKMRVALAIAFSKNSSCYVLHGVIPWLDKKGREHLFIQIQKAKKNGASIILFEHETNLLNGVVEKVFEFDGKTTKEIGAKSYFSLNNTNPKLEKMIQSLTTTISLNKPRDKILECNNLFLSNHPYGERNRNEPLLNNISFSLSDNNIYCLLGNNGSGKSTIAQIAFRIINPDSGNILLSGRLLKEYHRNELIQLICYVGQHPEHQITHSTYGQFKKEAQLKKNTLSLELMNKHLNLSDAFPVSLFSPLERKLICLISFLTDKTKIIILDEHRFSRSDLI